MKTLTVRQPWASLIVAGQKTVENRSRPTAYRGPLAIHAGKSTAHIGPGSALITGAIIGIVDLVDCLPLAAVDPAELEAHGPWCWILRHPRRITPIFCRGSLSFFESELPAEPVTQATQTTR